MKKIRKPRKLHTFSLVRKRFIDSYEVKKHFLNGTEGIVTQNTFVNLDSAKKLHAWLGKAIIYLESREK